MIMSSAFLQSIVEMAENPQKEYIRTIQDFCSLLFS